MARLTSTTILLNAIRDLTHLKRQRRRRPIATTASLLVLEPLEHRCMLSGIAAVLNANDQDASIFSPNSPGEPSATASAPVIRRVGIPTRADFEADIDVLEIVAGEYKPKTIELDRINRQFNGTTRPLLVRPAKNAAVIWNGINSGTDGAFTFGNVKDRGESVSYITFDGSGGGNGGSWLFTNYNLGSTGLFWMGGSHHLTFKHLDVSGIKGIREGYNSHIFYVSNNVNPLKKDANGNDTTIPNPPSLLESGRSHDITISNCRIDGGNHTLTGMQAQHEPGPYNIVFSHNTVYNASAGVILNAAPSNQIAVYDNSFVDCDFAIKVKDGIHGYATGNTLINSAIEISDTAKATFTVNDSNSPTPAPAVIGTYTGGAYTFVARQDGRLLKLDSRGIQVGYQEFSGRVTSLLYASSQNQLIVGLSDGRMLKVKGVGGTGSNMFGVKESIAGFESLPNYNYYLGTQKLSVGVNGLYSAASYMLVALTDGKLLKISGTGGTGVNMLALVEKNGVITSKTGYNYLKGTQQFSSRVTGILYSSSQNVTVLGLSDGRMLKVRNVGGTGANMFAIGQTSEGFASVAGYNYLLGSQKFSYGLSGLYEAAGYMFICLADGKLLKLSGTGGTGYNMLAVKETAGTITGAGGASDKYWKGTQQFPVQVSRVSYLTSEKVTVITLSDGRMLKINGTGGTGQNMFAIKAVGSEFASEDGYKHFLGNASLSRRFFPK